ncbi:MAG: hypothetical protein E7386_11620 [Ruminococcaceae bacterium]|nr:hypothetical protein [Oscillospiraceae bacterium]
MASDNGGTMASCETCQYAYIDEVTGEPVCDLDLDEDEVIRFAQSRSKECPFYKNGDEYQTTVKRQL